MISRARQFFPPSLAAIQSPPPGWPGPLGSPVPLWLATLDDLGLGPRTAFIGWEAHGDFVEVHVVVFREGLMGSDETTVSQPRDTRHARVLEDPQTLHGSIGRHAMNRHVLVPRAKRFR